MVTDAKSGTSSWARACLALTLVFAMHPAHAAGTIVVFQSDFGLKDHAVAAMRGVARQVDPTLVLENLTHEIPAFDVWQAAYRLDAVLDYWPKGTVFVSVVDPGVGTQRRSVVMRTGSGHLIVTPDNGTLTLVAERLGVSELREIDESINRLPGSKSSHTFHGRDVYAFTGARLASGQIAFNEVGPRLAASVVKIPYRHAALVDATVEGTIPVLDPQYGNVWTNIGRGLVETWGLRVGDHVQLTILRGDEGVVTLELPYVQTFGDVPMGEPLLYFNSLERLAIALNQGDFAARHGVGSGSQWRVTLTRLRE
ncbi:MAG: S-adenosyl-l-methionine hydroxide adenosyltransferase family protein [Pseudomonadales bacterium]